MFSDGVHISLTASITIGSGCFFSTEIYVSDHNHGIYGEEQQSNRGEPSAHGSLGTGGPVILDENVWGEDNSVILGSVSIGNAAIVGANSAVRGILPASKIVAGAPATPIKVLNSKIGRWDKA